MLALAGCVTKSPLSSVARATEFKVRDYTVDKLPNGLTIMWLPDMSLPYLSFQLLVKVGSAQDPVGREGLAFDTARMLSQGTTTRGAPQIAEDIEQIGGFFGRDVQNDATIISTSSLSMNRKSLLEQFREVVLSPSFPPKELERERKNILASLSKIGDSAEAFAEIQSERFYYGDHPYAHVVNGTFKAQAAINASELKGFYDRYYRPSNSILAVTGQYDAEFKNQIIAAFSGWPDKTLTKAEVPEVPAIEGVRTRLIDRPDLNQAQIQILGRGIARATPEYLEVRAAIRILGDFFLGSRLAEEIRVKRGLTYGIRAGVDPRVQPGPFSISTYTRVDKAAETVRETLNVYRNFVKNGVTEGEVDAVKALMRGQFPRVFETPEALARQLLLLELYGVPLDYLANYYANIDRLNKASLDAAIAKYFAPENLRILVYAPRASVEAELKSLGPVEVVPYKTLLR